MARGDDDFQRARRPEQKRQREAAILEAARRLALRDGVRNISLADIAADVGMHKTALLRYFGTREEIYLHIATEAWQEWAKSLSAALGELSLGDVPGIAKAFATSLDMRPLLCDLFTHAPLNLERNVSLTAVITFKLSAITAVKILTDAVRELLPTLTEDDGNELLVGITTLAAGLWQLGHPPPHVAKLYVEHPAMSHTAIEFVSAITRLTETLALGLLAKRAR
ncbi:TetR/AcrR family transcriptional regulator [Actinophytocola algeriensis]|jgi:AcrR family transcriptional regulator|uniref:AcrR family transcriptional regulator n=1 Tax=Actinophytocola algeriensis TaxID=1768010 RepID=A0A7W7Q6C0_9PSEU|nr:TetR/AcrR family transcriptional regulator [Actinophytocola algeriensis]MBB4907892.1 AcrR family transcriptional regulator [Actinophytocola algeriensis]MBE1479922.1 AcrR family transcriptional regulator [Actinophytocola algeriensis]